MAAKRRSRVRSICIGCAGHVQPLLPEQQVLQQVRFHPPAPSWLLLCPGGRLRTLGLVTAADRMHLHLTWRAFCDGETCRRSGTKGSRKVNDELRRNEEHNPRNVLLGAHCPWVPEACHCKRRCRSCAPPSHIWKRALPFRESSITAKTERYSIRIY